MSEQEQRSTAGVDAPDSAAPAVNVANKVEEQAPTTSEEGVVHGMRPATNGPLPSGGAQGEPSAVRAPAESRKPRALGTRYVHPVYGPGRVVACGSMGMMMNNDGTFEITGNDLKFENQGGSSNPTAAGSSADRALMSGSMVPMPGSAAEGPNSGVNNFLVSSVSRLISGPMAGRNVQFQGPMKLTRKLVNGCETVEFEAYFIETAGEGMPGPASGVGAMQAAAGQPVSSGQAGSSGQPGSSGEHRVVDKNAMVENHQQPGGASEADALTCWESDDDSSDDSAISVPSSPPVKKAKKE